MQFDIATLLGDGLDDLPHGWGSIFVGYCAFSEGLAGIWIHTMSCDA
jgi:hypothetical protein